MVFVPKINKVIRILITTDVLIYGAWGLVTPIFAVFIVDSIDGGSAQVAGIAAGIYWIVKSLLQFPIGKYLDTNNGERDDYWVLVVGTFIAAITPLGFIFVSEPWHLYLIQIIYGIGMAMVIPSWGGIFIRHMNKGLEAETWGLESSSLGLAVGAAGFAGGFLATTIGFTPLFIGVSSIGIFSSLLLLVIKNDISPKKKGETVTIKTTNM